MLAKKLGGEHMAKKFLVILAAALIVSLSLCSGVYAYDGHPQAADGILDLTQWNFEQQGMVRLNGKWEFYWEQLLEPKDFETSNTIPLPQFVQVPHAWGTAKIIGKTVPNEGFATYRLLVEMNESERNIPKSLYIHSIATSYRLWVNGTLAAENGVVGENREQMVPKTYSRVFHFEPGSNEVELIIQVSNFVQRKGGMWTSIELGNQDAVALAREWSIAEELFIFAALFVMGMYHLMLFAMRRTDKLSLMLGSFCVLFAFRYALLGNTLLVRYFPMLDWEIAVKIEYLSPYIAIPLFTVYAYLLYPNELNRTVVAAVAAAGTPFVAVVVLFPARIYTYTMAAYQVFTMIVFTYILLAMLKAMYHRREGACMNGIGLIVMIAAVINDFLYYNHMITSIDLAPFGFLFVVFIQTLIVALKFSNAFAKVERLTTELQQVNVTLEQKVGERTESLEQTNLQLAEANANLQRAEASRRQLVTNISHELGTPMTIVQGYMKAILDGILPLGDPKTFLMIYQKILYINKLVQDLFELSKLEAFKIRFELIDVPAKELFEAYFRKFQFDVEGKGIRFELVPIPKREADGLPPQSAMLHIDPLRIEQVVANIVYNAVKFTPRGGLIRIEGELNRNIGGSGGQMIILISDTGTGIDPEELPHIFERFYKGKAKGDQEAVEGSGLGLVIAQEIVQQHNGEISVTSELGRGSTFRIALPIEYRETNIS